VFKLRHTQSANFCKLSMLHTKIQTSAANNKYYRRAGIVLLNMVVLLNGCILLCGLGYITKNTHKHDTGCIIKTSQQFMCA